MKLHLFLDLDDTLLHSDPEKWGPAYFGKLAKALEGKAPAEKVLETLASGVQIMFASRNPGQTLEQAFNAHFYPKLGITYGELDDRLNQFYEEVFPTLQPMTSPIPEAQSFVEWAFDQGWEVSVATDPLFPRKAILHRLRWANLAPETHPFRLITDFESFHFAKIQGAFYPEALVRAGWTDGPALMIGDSLERDIYPAQKAGVPAYWLRRPEAARAGTEHIPQGWYGDLKAWLMQADEKNLAVHMQSNSANQLSLLGAPAVLHSISRKSPPETWITRPARDAWALTEIICHLRDVENEVNLRRIESVLAEENAFIAGQNTDPWVEERGYIHQNGQQALTEYLSARATLLEKLRNLPQESWERKARHTIFGPTTLLELVSFMAEHDRAHIQQALRPGLVLA